ncbi:pyruvate, phosphate dikinase, partial [bacterium]|nr:pyruvate, phosphate dikinase [bacterium]
HAALVARGWGKCCIVGCADIDVNTAAKTMKVAGKTFKEGDVISLNGSKGYVYGTAVKTMDASENPALQKFMKLVDKNRKMKIRTNADNPADAAQALKFGAEGIGLFRTEHMFYGKNSEKPLFLLRQMILAKDVKEREAILAKLGVYVKASVKDTMKVMNGKPVVFRLLDPPLHEFVPQDEAKQKELAAALKIDVKEVRERGEGLHEVNPMMGHRGVRLGVTYPEVSKMQFKAIFEATAELHKEGFNPKPEIMVPVTCSVNELKFQKKLCDEVFEQVKKATGDKKLSYMFGTMIEIPRAALLADEMAEVAEFFSFGTNDMTQMGFGFSRDDIGAFMGDYLDKKILPADPFQTLDQDGIGQLVQIGTMLGRDTRPNLEVGICGEHGGDAESVKFCYFNGLDYVSCSPFRVPIARLAAAQAAIEEERSAKKCKCGKCK